MCLVLCREGLQEWPCSAFKPQSTSVLMISLHLLKKAYPTWVVSCCEGRRTRGYLDESCGATAKDGQCAFDGKAEIVGHYGELLEYEELPHTGIVGPYGELLGTRSCPEPPVRGGQLKGLDGNRTIHKARRDIPALK